MADPKPQFNTSSQENKKNNKEIVAGYLTKVLSNKELCDFMKKASHALNLFGKKYLLNNRIFY